MTELAGRREGAGVTPASGHATLKEGSGEARLAKSQHRRGDIQGLRAVAVLMVVAFHAGLPVPGGFVGVDVFFVISGYVITAMLMREWSSTGRIGFRSFYWRRFKRLTPALALTVTVTLIASVLVLSPLGPLGLSAQTGLGAMLLAANAVISQTTEDYFAPAAATNALLNTWSLSVEEQFYLLFPAVLAFVLLIGRRTRWGSRLLYMTFIAAIFASFAIAVIGSSGAINFSVGGALFGFYSPVTRAWEFAAGGLLSLGAAKLAGLTRGMATIIAAAGSGGLAVSMWVIDAATPFPGLWTVLPVAATLCLLAAGATSNPVSDLLARRTPQAVGDGSYSLYLWHWPVIVLAVALWPNVWWVPVAAAVVSVIPAFVSYRYVETPIRMANVGRNTPMVARRLVLAVMIPPVLVSLAVLWLPNLNPTIRELRASLEEPYPARSAGCEHLATNGLPTGTECVWNAEASGEPIYLVGDSNADHFAAAIIGAGRDLDRPVTLLINYSCPFAELTLIDDANPGKVAECSEFTEQVESFLATVPPADVVVATTDTYWTEPRFAVAPASGGSVHNDDERLGVFETGLASSVGKLTSAGHRVHLVQTVPRWTGEYYWGPEQCRISTLLADECKTQASTEGLLVAQGATRDVIERVARTSSVGVIDPWPWICPEGLCETESDGLQRYRDPGHLTVSQSRELADEFRQTLVP